MLLREPATIRCGPCIMVVVHGRELLLQKGSRGARCQYGERELLLERECGPNSTFDEALLPLKQKLLHGKGRQHSTVRWFDRDAESGDLLLWKQKTRDGLSSVCAISVLCPTVLLCVGHDVPCTRANHDLSCSLSLSMSVGQIVVVSTAERLTWVDS